MSTPEQEYKFRPLTSNPYWFMSDDYFDMVMHRRDVQVNFREEALAFDNVLPDWSQEALQTINPDTPQAGYAAASLKMYMRRRHDEDAYRVMLQYYYRQGNVELLSAGRLLNALLITGLFDDDVVYSMTRAEVQETLDSGRVSDIEPLRFRYRLHLRLLKNSDEAAAIRRCTGGGEGFLNWNSYARMVGATILANYGDLDRYGMLEPTRQNFLEDCHLYRAAMMRRESVEELSLRNYQSLTDKEIVDKVQGVLPYSRRAPIEEMLDSAIATTIGGGTDFFFVPWREGIPEDVDYTPILWEDPRTTEDHVVGLHSIDQVSYFTTEELEGYINLGDVESVVPVGFSRPDTGEALTAYQMKQLENLPLPQTFLNKVREAREYAEGAHEDRIRQWFYRLSNENQQQVRSYLGHLANVALYARRWQGPGHPIPYRREDADISYIPDAEITQELIALGEYSESIKNVINELFVRDREGREKSETVGRLTRNVYNGRECLRVASGLLINTTTYYIRLFFGSDELPFDPSRFENINLYMPEERN